MWDEIIIKCSSLQVKFRYVVSMPECIDHNVFTVIYFRNNEYYRFLSEI